MSGTSAKIIGFSACWAVEVPERKIIRPASMTLNFKFI
jgi:hypothetical protein